MEVGSVIVVAAGEGPTTPLNDLARKESALKDGAVTAGLVPVIAADGGLERARALDLKVSVVIGDFDSADPAAIEAARADGATVLRFPTAKDATDLELALDHALTLGPSRIVVIASGGGRLDHLLASCLGLASPSLAGVEVDAHVGSALVHVVRNHRMLRGRPGEIVSLLALGGPAIGVRTVGLEYPLLGETLEPGSSRGVSNTFVAANATVSVESGVLLAVRPDPEALAA